MRSGSSSISCEDYPRFCIGLDLQFVRQIFVSFDQSLVIDSISESGGMRFPRCLVHESDIEPPNNMGTGSLVPQASLPANLLADTRPLMISSTNHGIDEFDAVVIGRIVTCSDHHTDGLTIEFPRA